MSVIRQIGVHSPKGENVESTLNGEPLTGNADGNAVPMLKSNESSIKWKKMNNKRITIIDSV